MVVLLFLGHNWLKKWNLYIPWIKSNNIPCKPRISNDFYQEKLSIWILLLLYFWIIIYIDRGETWKCSLIFNTCHLYSCRWQNCTQCSNQVLVKEMKGLLAFISNDFQMHFIPYWSSSTQMALPLLSMTYKQYLMTSAKLMASSIPGNAPRSSWTIFLPMDIISAWKRNKCGRQWWVVEYADSCPVIADFTVILTVR